MSINQSSSTTKGAADVCASQHATIVDDMIAQELFHFGLIALLFLFVVVAVVVVVGHSGGCFHWGCCQSTYTSFLMLPLKLLDYHGDEMLFGGEVIQFGCEIK